MAADAPCLALAIETHSQEETGLLGQKVAALLPRGSVVALRGELATGKTCFVRGMAAHFAKSETIHSPTFTLINEYGEAPKLYHVDLFRVAGPGEAAELGLAEIFGSEDVCAIEWADRAETLLPSRRLDVYLEHAGHDRRLIRLHDHGILPQNWQKTLL